MNVQRTRRLVALALVIASMSAAPTRGAEAGAATRPAAAMERVAVAPDGRGFVRVPSGGRFVPWGLNYGNAGRLIEDFWADDWATLAADFDEMRALGANVARVHLQLGMFMDAADAPNAASLDRLTKLLDLAERTGLYLDLTGLACYRPADVPAWYDALPEAERWAVQARFWSAVAERCAKSPAVFCYDLMNEPLVPGEAREPREWYSGKLFGGYDFLQFVSLDPAGRPRDHVARDWIRTLTRAIRAHDKERLITVGLLPSTPQWGHFSGFLPATVGPELDFVSVHVYPEAGKVDEALATLRGFQVEGKPLVVEETFNLTCSPADLRRFLLASRDVAHGWMGHYDGTTVERYEALRDAKSITLPQQFWLDFLKLFAELREEMTATGGRASTRTAQ